jgi:hypothetical protein
MRLLPNLRFFLSVPSMMRSIALTASLLVVLAACGGESGSETSSPATDSPSTSEGRPLDGLPEGPSALTDLDSPDLPPPLVDISQIISGGPPPDGIPPIDSPQFRTIAESDPSMQDSEAVVALEVGGEARAYPVQILIWHEIVNDTVGGVPVAITYCPLCNSAISYRRQVRGVETTFGTSGSLYASALVMYDRATESLWTHFDGRAVAGVLTGEQLEPISSPLLSWADFKAAYPDGTVLSTETGHRRDYGRNPYTGYDDPDSLPFLFLGTPDDRARAKERVVGISVGDDSVAFLLAAVAGGEARATNSTVGETPVVILWKAGQATALEGVGVADGRDVGSVGVFLPLVDGRQLTFEASGDGYSDVETGTIWDVTGRAISGELAGSSLERIPHLDTFWFAWATYRPGTVLVGS